MKVKFTVLGMSCTACSSAVERAVNKVEGVTSATVSLTQKLMVVEGEFSNASVIKAVKDAGFKAKEYAGDSDLSDGNAVLRKRLIPSVILLVILMYFSMGGMIGLPTFDFLKGERGAVWFVLLQLLLTTAVIIINKKFFIGGYKAVIHLSPNMDTLVALGSGASYLFGIFAFIMIIVGKASGDSALVNHYLKNLYFESSAMILTLVTVGKMLEERSKKKTESAVEKLKSLAPSDAIVIRDGVELTIKVSELKLGDIVVIKQGLSAPADAVVIFGEGDMSESALTGESMPVYKEIGSLIKTATVCESGYMTAKVTALGEDTVFSKIIDYVLSAESSKAPVQRLADKISGIFVPIVTLIAIVTLIVWLIIGKPFDFAFSRAITVLVISCPCALGLATPVAVTVATGKCASFGALIKNADVLERIGQTSIIIMDKTGTVTQGKIKVGKVVGLSSEELQEISAVEKLSSHPLATAVCEYAMPCDLEVKDYLSVTGKGVKGTVNGNAYVIGNKSFTALYPIKEELKILADRSLSDGKSVLFVAKNGVVIGFLEVYDMIKETSFEAVNDMKNHGILTVILSGDDEKVSNRVKYEVDADEVYGGVLPEEKAEIVKKYKERGKVMFIGDGVNDSPALSVADVSVAMSSGTDIAVSSADVILLSNDLRSAVKAVKTGKKAGKIIKQNLFWAFIYNVLGIPLASGVLYFAGILLNPMIASLAMSLSSIFVVTNALRIYKNDK